MGSMPRATTARVSGLFCRSQRLSCLDDSCDPFHTAPSQRLASARNRAKDQPKLRLGGNKKDQWCDAVATRGSTAPAPLHRATNRIPCGRVFFWTSGAMRSHLGRHPAPRAHRSEAPTGSEFPAPVSVRFLLRKGRNKSRTGPTRLLILLAVAAMPALASGAVLAEDAAPPPAEREQAAGNEPDAAERAGAARSVLFERVRVVGSPDENQGSVSYLNAARLAQHDYADVHRILSQVPGINIQEEEGYGLRPNVGMRGSGSQRSAKITLLEDGVLIAPAPYSAPAAYYFPTPGRMEGVEVRKGSSSIQYGPHTNGGVINFVSSSIPTDEFGGSVNVAFGDNDTLRGRVKAGGSSQRFGWLVESYRWDTTGFKRLDTGGDTGVRSGGLPGQAAAEQLSPGPPFSGAGGQGRHHRAKRQGDLSRSDRRGLPARPLPSLRRLADGQYRNGPRPAAGAIRVAPQRQDRFQRHRVP